MSWPIVALGFLIGAFHPLGGLCLALGLLLSAQVYFWYKRHYGASIVWFVLFMALLQYILISFVIAIACGAVIIGGVRLL